MPTRVLLLRHAQSAMPHVFNGAESDVELSELGKRQSLAIAPILANYSPHVVISSAMKRAVQTAQPIASHCGVPHLIDELLHERKVGDLSGTAFSRTEGLWPATLKRWMSGETNYAPEGSESFDDIKNRVLPVWQRLATSHQEKTIIVVAHGIVCKVLLLTILPHLSTSDWESLGPIHNVGIHELILQDQVWRAEKMNEVSESVRRLN